MPLPRWITKSKFEVTPTPSLSKTRKGTEIGSYRVNAPRPADVYWHARVYSLIEFPRWQAGPHWIRCCLTTPNLPATAVSVPCFFAVKFPKRQKRSNRLPLQKPAEPPKRKSLPHRLPNKLGRGPAFAKQGPRNHPTCSLDVNTQRFMVDHYV